MLQTVGIGLKKGAQEVVYHQEPISRSVQLTSKVKAEICPQVMNSLHVKAPLVTGKDSNLLEQAEENNIEVQITTPETAPPPPRLLRRHNYRTYRG